MHYYPQQSHNYTQNFWIFIEDHVEVHYPKNMYIAVHWTKHDICLDNNNIFELKIGICSEQSIQLLQLINHTIKQVNSYTFQNARIKYINIKESVIYMYMQNKKLYGFKIGAKQKVGIMELYNYKLYAICKFMGSMYLVNYNYGCLMLTNILYKDILGNIEMIGGSERLDIQLDVSGNFCKIFQISNETFCLLFEYTLVIVYYDQKRKCCDKSNCLLNICIDFQQYIFEQEYNPNNPNICSFSQYDGCITIILYNNSNCVHWIYLQNFIFQFIVTLNLPTQINHACLHLTNNIKLQLIVVCQNILYYELTDIMNKNSIPIFNQINNLEQHLKILQIHQQHFIQFVVSLKKDIFLISNSCLFVIRPYISYELFLLYNYQCQIVQNEKLQNISSLFIKSEEKIKQYTFKLSNYHLKNIIEDILSNSIQNNIQNLIENCLKFYNTCQKLSNKLENSLLIELLILFRTLWRIFYEKNCHIQKPLILVVFDYIVPQIFKNTSFGNQIRSKICFRQLLCSEKIIIYLANTINQKGLYVIQLKSILLQCPLVHLNPVVYLLTNSRLKFIKESIYFRLNASKSSNQWENLTVSHLIKKPLYNNFLQIYNSIQQVNPAGCDSQQINSKIQLQIVRLLKNLQNRKKNAFSIFLQKLESQCTLLSLFQQENNELQQSICHQLFSLYNQMIFLCDHLDLQQCLSRRCLCSCLQLMSEISMNIKKEKIHSIWINGLLQAYNYRNDLIIISLPEAIDILMQNKVRYKEQKWQELIIPMLQSLQFIINDSNVLKTAQNGQKSQNGQNQRFI